MKAPVGNRAVENDGLRVVRFTGMLIADPGDTDASGYPYRLEVNLSPPELMLVASVMLHGGCEEVVVRGKTRAAIDQFVDRTDLRAHPRLRRMTITGPGGLREEVRQ